MLTFFKIFCKNSPIGWIFSSEDVLYRKNNVVSDSWSATLKEQQKQWKEEITEGKFGNKLKIAYW